MTPELFISSLVVNISTKLGPIALRAVSLSLGLEEELRKLEDTLSSIKAGLLDAEKKQALNHLVRDWLEKLQDLCLDADDLLDEIECEALRRQVVKDGRTSRKLRRFFSRRNPLAFRFNMSHEIKDIRERLQKIDDDKARFKFTELDENSQNTPVVPTETHSFIRDTDVIGRELDRDEIVKLLSYGECLSVIPILGIGGMGKTALAKLVYNDRRVKKHFKKKMWIHVSVDSDAKKLIKATLKACEKFNRDDPTVDSLDSLKTKLQEALAGKRFLLVMDDVWIEDRAEWDKFRDLLTVCARGSKIIVTTRSQEVAKKMGDVPPYNLEGLSEEDCRTVFVRCAFKEGDHRRFPNLREMGYEIVKKCGGVPLAVRTLGCLLYSKTDVRDWKHIKDNEIWSLPQYANDILPALKLSYDQLPPHLKRCFAYCSMFPKEYEFSSDDLIQFWMAHDLIQPWTGNQDLEDIGEQYIKELQSGSFFQRVSYDYNFKFKMHDLMHDLATSVAPSTCSTVNSRTKQEDFSIRVRHLSFADPNLSLARVPVFLNKSNRLRTIIFHDTAKEVSSSFLDVKIIPRFQYLRMLNLSRSRFEVLPSSIGSMRHMRYLDLSWNCKIEELPRSVYKLQSLLTLKLDGCSELKTLPKKIGKLISLRFLGITTKDWYMPESGIGCLSSLRFLKFEGCEYLETLFEDIQLLQKLQTFLIYKCRRLSSLPLGMSSLSSLKTLVISYCEKLDLEENLNGLRLRSLVLEHLPQLEALPEWLIGSARTLEYMRIELCLNLYALPEWLQQFQSLQELVLTRCQLLSSLPEGMRRLSALRKLTISDCFLLTRKCQRPTGKVWNKIARVKEWNKIAHVSDIYVDSIKQ